MREEIRRYMETNENENITTQTVWDAAKAVLRRKYIVIQAYLKKQEKSQIQYRKEHIKAIEAVQQRHPKSSKKEIIKNRVEINDIESKKNRSDQRKEGLVFLKK